MSEPLDRPGSLEGHTYKLKWPDSDHALYITINDIMLHGHRRPFEIFINSKNMEHFAWTVALTRMISAVFRRGGDVSFVVEELKAVFDPRGGAWMNGKYVPSILAAIGGVIERHLISIGFIDGEGMGLKTDPQAEVVNLGRPRAGLSVLRAIRHAHDRGLPDLRQLRTLQVRISHTRQGDRSRSL
jgi:ribonucleoside-diphosphate reductase alpha chain